MTDEELATLARRAYADALEASPHNLSAARGRAVAAVSAESDWDASTTRQFVERMLREGR